MLNFRQKSVWGTEGKRDRTVHSLNVIRTDGDAKITAERSGMQVLTHTVNTQKT